MVRSFRLLALAFAMLTATAASASAAEFHIESLSGVVSGGGTATHSFGMQAGFTSCKVTTLKGEAPPSKTTSSITLVPTYGECENALLGKVTVDMNGCDYVFTQPNNSLFSIDLVCPNGKQVQLTSELCTIDIPPKTMSQVKYTNTGSGSGRDVDLQFELSLLDYVQTGVFCPGNGFSAQKTFTDGTYSGPSTLTAESVSTGKVGFWIE